MKRPHREQGSPLPARTLWGSLFPVIFMLILSVLMTWPLILHIGSAVTSPCDPLFGAYLLAHGARLMAHPMGYADSHMFFPLRGSFLTENHMIGTALLGVPIYLLTGNAVADHNVVFILTYFLNSLFMYLLVKDLTGSRAAATIGGIVYAYAPFKFDLWGNLLSSQWMPLAFLFLRRYVISASPSTARSGAPSLRPVSAYMALFGLFFGIQMLADLNLAAFFLPVPVLYMIYCLVLGKVRLSRRLAMHIVTAGIIIFALNAPFTMPLFQSKSARIAGSFRRDIDEQVLLSADIRGYLLTPPQNRLYGWITRRCKIFGGQHAFPGLLALVLCAGAFLPRKRIMDSESEGVWYRQEKFFFLFLALFGFAMSLGPKIQFFGHAVSYGPYMLCRVLVPGYDRIRAIGWMTIVFLFAVAGLSGIGCERLLTSLKTLHQRNTVVLCLVLILLIEYNNDNAHAGFWSRTDKGYYHLAQEPPPVYRWLKSQQGDFGIIELPMPVNNGEFEVGGYEMIYAIRALYHGKRIANGYGSFRPPHYWPLIDLMSDFPSPESLSVLQSMGIRYVILHTEPPNGLELSEECPGSVSMAIVEKAMADKEDLRFVNRFGTDYVFEVMPLRVQHISGGVLSPAMEILPLNWTARTDIHQKEASRAFDRNCATSWSTYRGYNLYNNNHSFELDLGRTVLIDGIELDYDHKFHVPRGLRVEISEDGTRWEKMNTREAYAELITRLVYNPSDRRMVIRIPAVRARYIRLTETLPQLDWSINELRIFSTEGGTRERPPAARG